MLGRTSQGTIGNQAGVRIFQRPHLVASRRDAKRGLREKSLRSFFRKTKLETAYLFELAARPAHLLETHFVNLQIQLSWLVVTGTMEFVIFSNSWDDDPI
jgi:hypothetical protein